ncbi:NYN domain-containing protein [Candidatus Falkowbacteria bacterium]|nr:NYN domain-containing protein [Candidatus Falkowbacteria bacterium]
MDTNEFEKETIRDDLEISEKEYGKIFSFVDFANVNKWFQNDNQDWNSQLLKMDEVLVIDLNKLKNFSDIFSEKTRVYYGEDPKNKKSLSFTYVIRKIFGKRSIITKDVQKIKHYIDSYEDLSSKVLITDKDNQKYIEIRKCNFDVEISVDAIKMINHYDTFCIFSGDADFVYLNNFLKKRGKKIIIVKGGYITTKLRKTADLIINAQRIKKYIAKIEKTKT